MATLEELYAEAVNATDGEILGEKCIIWQGEPHWVPENLDVSKLDKPEPRVMIGEVPDEVVADAFTEVLEECAETAEAVSRKLDRPWGWVPETHEDVDRIVTRMLCAEQELALYKAAYKDNSEAAKKEIEYLEARYGEHVQRDAVQHLEKGAQYARYSAGRVQFRQVKPHFKVADQKLLQEWLGKISTARQESLGVTVKEIIFGVDLEKLYALAESLKDTPEIVPGVEWIAAGSDWSVQPPKAGAKKANEQEYRADQPDTSDVGTRDAHCQPA